MSLCIKSGGTWRNVGTQCVKHSGSWRNVTTGCIKSGGTWRKYGFVVPLRDCPMGTCLCDGLLVCRNGSTAWISEPVSSTCYRCARWSDSSFHLSCLCNCTSCRDWFLPDCSFLFSICTCNEYIVPRYSPYEGMSFHSTTTAPPCPVLCGGAPFPQGHNERSWQLNVNRPSNFCNISIAYTRNGATYFCRNWIAFRTESY